MDFNADLPRALCPPASTDPPQAPEQLRAASTVVLGAGPVGLITALLLHQRGVHTTVLEQSPSVDAGDAARSYNIFLFLRARKVLRLVPGLLEKVRERALLRDDTLIQLVDMEGASKQLSAPGFPSSSGEDDPEVLLRRGALISVLDDAVRACAGIKIVRGAAVRNVALDGSGDGAIRVEYNTRADNVSLSLTTRLVLACDGWHSRGADALARFLARGESVWHTPSSPVVYKAMAAEDGAAEHLLGLPAGADDGRSTIFVRGRHFPAVLSNAPGGEPRVLSVTQNDDHAIWQARTGADVETMLRESYPALDLIGPVVKKSALDAFAQAPSKPFGPVRLAAAQAAAIGGRCGVILLGDAAHSFPPDLGQGANAGFEDVGVLLALLDGMAAGAADTTTETGQTDASPAALARLYEDARADDAAALCQIMRFGAPWQYGQNRAMAMWSMARSRLRARVVRLAPQLFNPRVSIMTLSDMSYTEALRRALATRRLMTGLAVLATAGVAAAAVALRPRLTSFFRSTDGITAPTQ